MRVRFEWTVSDSLKLPMSHHQILQGVIYRNLKDENGYSDFIHNTGYASQNRHFRMFCFSNIRGKHTVEDNQILFSGRISFDVSSPEVYMIRSLADHVYENGLTFGRTRYPDVNILLTDYRVEENDILVRAISPITVYTTDKERKTRYFTPFEKDFATSVDKNFQRKYLAYYGMQPECHVEIEPVNVEKKDKCITRYKATYITGYQGTYHLSGESKALDFLFQAGIGSKNAQGFGMVEPFP